MKKRLQARLQKRLLDFLYWYRHGNTVRQAWRLSDRTL